MSQATPSQDSPHHLSYLFLDLTQFIRELDDEPAVALPLVTGEGKDTSQVVA